MNNNSIGNKYPSQAHAAIGANLRILRRHKKITRAAVAYEAQISVSTLRKLELGDCASVSIFLLFDVCSYYQVEPHTILIDGYYDNPSNLPIP
ncbi:helix-turn-helix domain-containing protein [Pseudoflavitalea rhizosphaerae]|uniref:helix-turn-helix domain-containing protein n=1 Tax=Pseudoflavitalea rhizosphaerae TaxID=1884793 RepID=UPI000F8DC87A